MDEEICESAEEEVAAAGIGESGIEKLVRGDTGS